MQSRAQTLHSLKRASFKLQETTESNKPPANSLVKPTEATNDERGKKAHMSNQADHKRTHERYQQRTSNHSFKRKRKNPGCEIPSPHHFTPSRSKKTRKEGSNKTRQIKHSQDHPRTDQERKSGVTIKRERIHRRVDDGDESHPISSHFEGRPSLWVASHSCSSFPQKQTGLLLPPGRSFRCKNSRKKAEEG